MVKFPMVRGGRRADGTWVVLELRQLCIAIQVVDAFLKLEKPYQDAIAEVTQKMGAGMAEFIEKEASAAAMPNDGSFVWPDPRHHEQVVSLEDYNKYCFYVAGLVGVGLSRLFTAGGASQHRLVTSLSLLKPPLRNLRPGMESNFYAVDANKGEKGLSNGMGLFLQKTNIIRDYLEVRAPTTPFVPCLSSHFAARAGYHGGTGTADVLATGGVEQVR
jgi:hypothetical protein